MFFSAFKKKTKSKQKANGFASTSNSKTLKRKMNEYFFKKNNDFCCEKDIDRKKVIAEIFEKYKRIKSKSIEQDPYLAFIDNDLVIFIGYRIDLVKNKDVEGLKLWSEISKNTYDKDPAIQKMKIEKLLYSLPLYYLLAFLGFAAYRESVVNTKK
jgi:hypothetical protein